MKLGDQNESPFSLSTTALEDACDDLSLEQNRPIIISFQDNRHLNMVMRFERQRKRAIINT